MSKMASNRDRTTRLQGISRRRLLSGVPVLGGLLATGCSDVFRPPTVRGGLIGAADVLTMSTSRWLLRDQPLAREYDRSAIAPAFPTWGQTDPRDEDYQRHLSEGFQHWSLPVGGLVERPRVFSLEDLKRLPSRPRSRRMSASRGGRRSPSGPASRWRSCSRRPAE